MTSIGVVAGLEPEVRALRRMPETFCVAVSGMGEERAYRAATRLVQSGASALVSWGCAAALDPKLVPGTLVVPRAVVGASGAAHVVRAEWQEAIVGVLHAHVKVHTGALAGAARTLATAHEKRELLARCGAAAADRESAGVARAARELGVPFVAIRAIADGVEVAVPPALERAVGDDGGIDVAASAARLVLSPWHWPAAVRLGLGFRAALLSLRVAAPALYASAPAAGAFSRHAVEPELRDARVVRA